MKKYVKKKIKNLAISLTCSILLASSVVMSGYNSMAEIVHEDNSSNAQIEEYQDKFDVVSGYRHYKGERLQHNNDEPIYIQIDNDFTSKQKETIIQALDFIFGLVGEINDRYKYVIVDDVNNTRYSNKTKIKFEKEETVLYRGDEVLGLYTTINNIFKSKTKGAFIARGNIYLESENAEDLNELYYTVLHETFHLFGVRDVYSNWQEELYYNTYININIIHKLKMITPNDYKLLISLYGNDMSEASDKEKQDYIAQIEQKIDNYTRKYYVHYQQVYKQTLIDRGFSDYDVKANTTYVTLENDLDLTFTETLALKGISKIRVKVKDDKYMLETYDAYDNLLERCSGKAYNVGGQIFLHNVELKNFKKGRPTYIDLCMYMRADNTVYFLKDTVNTLYSATGIETEYYNQQSLTQ